MGTERYIDALLEEDIISAAETLRSEDYDGNCSPGGVRRPAGQILPVMGSFLQ